MTIKKPMKAPETATQAVTPATGGATIADRFKLDTTTAPAPKAAAGKSSMIAVAAGLVALAVVGLLTYLLWQHWEFLMPA